MNGSSRFRGVIFEFDPLLGLITTKAEFDGTSGAFPTSAPISIGGNKFLGDTNSGGTVGYGAIYEYDFSNSTLTYKASFGVADGYDPGPALVQDAGTGLFFGTTTAGGANGYGSIYEYNNATGAITPRAAFHAAIGSPSYAYSGLISVGAGKYLGTATLGGANGAGAVYEFDSTTIGLTLLNSFDPINGYFPLGELVSIGNNNFLAGTIYSYTPTPGPVPLFGAAAAYSWSRKLRRRISAKV